MRVVVGEGGFDGVDAGARVVQLDAAVINTQTFSVACVKHLFRYVCSGASKADPYILPGAVCICSGLNVGIPVDCRELPQLLVCGLPRVIEVQFRGRAVYVYPIVDLKFAGGNRDRLGSGDVPLMLSCAARADGRYIIISNKPCPCVIKRRLYETPRVIGKPHTVMSCRVIAVPKLNIRESTL